MDDSTLAKVWSCLILFTSSLLCGLLPLKARKIILKSKIVSAKASEALLSSCICFGAGILLATTFLHILEETRHKFTKLQEEGIVVDTEYPIPELVLCNGFFLIYLLEEVVHFFADHRSPGGTRQPHKKLNKSQLEEIEREHCLSSKWNCETNSKKQEKSSHIIESLKIQTESSDSSDGFPSSEERIDHRHSVDEVNSLRSIMMVVALSFHGCFEGLALGLASKEKDVWLLCLALASHKIFIGFSIGMELLEVGVSKLSFIVQIVIFSLASPVGAILGALLTETLDTSSTGKLVISIFEGLSGGTILYVVFCEILERERSNSDNRAIKFVAILIGFWLMAAMQTVHGDCHDGSSITYNQTQVPLS